MEIAKTIAEKSQEKGWRALLVGGAVRDMMLGSPSKDIDIEVYGASIDELHRFLKQFGKVDAVGKSFGVFKLRINGRDIDVSSPRRESKTGRGHKGFMMEPDPSMTISEASERRDYTMNALAYDPLTDEIIDFHGGLDDLLAGEIRATSERFVDDPLRVLRGMQQGGRFGLEVVDKATLEMCRQVKDEYQDLSVERVWGEWEKWAQKSRWPSAGLIFLAKAGWLSLYPHLEAQLECPQDPEWHPEIWLWLHTLYAVDQAALIAERDGLADDEKMVLVLASLLHDIAKPYCTTFDDDEHIRSRGHDTDGGPMAGAFLESIGAPTWIAEHVVPLVQEHMFHVHNRNPNSRSVRRLSVRLGKASIEQLVRLIEVDHSSRPPLLGGIPEAAQKALRLATKMEVREEKPKPLVMGRHLIKLGMRPGKAFGPILRQAYEAQLDGKFGHTLSGILWLGLANKEVGQAMKEKALRIALGLLGVSCLALAAVSIAAHA